MSWREVRESVKRETDRCGGSVVAAVRPSLMAKSSAPRMVVWGWSFQLVEVCRVGRYMAALVEGGEGMCEPSVKMKKVSLYLVERRVRKRAFPW